MNTQSPSKTPSVIKRTYDFFKIPIAIGFVCGASLSLLGHFFDFEFGHFFERTYVFVGLGASETTALVLGVIFVIVGLGILPGTLSAKLGVKQKIFVDEVDWEDQRKVYFHSAIGIITWGLLLIGLMLIELIDQEQQNMFFAALAAIFVALLYSCWRLLQEFDELWHEVNRAMCVYGFYGLFFIGGTWSALAHLGLIGALSPLGWINLLTAASLVGSVFANGERGLLVK